MVCKRILVLALLIVFAAALFSACANVPAEAESVQEDAVSETAGAEPEDAPEPEEPDTEPAPSEEEPAAPEEPDGGSDTLVIYFSRTGEQYGVGVIDKGNTAVVAEIVAEATGADMFEIIPKDDYYPTTYDELTEVAAQEQKEGARPEYAGPVPDLTGYDTVFIGAPVWWGDWPMIMYTFFENEDLSGKTLIPFSTHAGSGLAGFDSKLEKAVPDAEVKEGLAVFGEDCQEDESGVRDAVEGWLGGLGF